MRTLRRAVMARDDFPPATFDPQQLAALPLDVPALRAALLTMMDCDPGEADSPRTAGCLVQAIQRSYGTWVVPADLAAAMWEVLAAQPDVKDMGATVDRLGRPAWAVGLETPSGEVPRTTTVLLISPQTGRLTGTETVTLRDDALGVDEPTVTGFEA